MRKALVALGIGSVVLAGLSGVAAGSGPASVTGSVAVASSGAGLAGVCVRLLSTPTRSPLGRPIHTSAAGQFRFTGLLPGSYVVATCLPASSPYAQASAPAQATAQGGAAVKLSLGIGGKIAGVVVGSTGRPAVRLTVIASPTTGAMQPGQLLAPARTAGNGHYTITNLVPGGYFIEIGAQAGPSDRWGYGPTHSAIVNVGAGAVATAPRLVVEAEGGITGKAVSSSTGRPLGGTCLQATGPGVAYPVTTTRSGHFRITGLLPGRWTISLCFATHGSGKGRSASIVVRPGRGSAAGRLRLP